MPDGVAEASSPDATMDASNPRDGSSPDAASDAHDGGAPDGGGDAATGGDTKGDAAAPASLVWRALTVPGIEPESITALWGSGPIELYVGTSKGKVIHRNAAGTWSSQALPGGVPGIYWIWGSGANDIYATTGTSAGLYHSTGDDVWTPVTLPDQYFGFPAQVRTTRGIWGTGPNEVFVVGSLTYMVDPQTPTVGAIFHLKDGAWTVSAANEPLYQIWGSSPSDLYVIGGVGQSLYHSVGDDMWTRQSVASGNGPGAVWGTDAANVYVITTTYNRNMGPTLVFRSAGSGTWTQDFSIETSETHTMWGSGPDDVYLGGEFNAESSFDNHAVLYHRAGDGQWTMLAVPTQPALATIDCVWGTDATNVYLGGRYSDLPTNGALLQGTPR